LHDEAAPLQSAAIMPLLPQLFRPEQLQAWRFADSDHCRLALICDPAHHSGGPTLLLEIHNPSDRVPPHRHAHAVELFFVLRGRVRFHVDGTTIEASTGDSVVVPEGSLHDYENPGPDRVYLLTVVSTDDGFADGLRHGIPTPLDAEDLAVLRSL
jgi:mannose-6-phosphate isomerase-like protein (cupin superfamily)